jgi:hypothetical protein
MDGIPDRKEPHYFSFADDPELIALKLESK